MNNFVAYPWIWKSFMPPRIPPDSNIFFKSFQKTSQVWLTQWKGNVAVASVEQVQIHDDFITWDVFVVNLDTADAGRLMNREKIINSRITSWQMMQLTMDPKIILSNLNPFSL